MDNMQGNDVAQRYREAAAELQIAAQHLNTAAQHMDRRDVPRTTAHAFAALGHIHRTDDIIKQLAMLHATKSSP
ncbi:MAG: hypothetical protein NVS2B7_21370 [Herpetosiphon sp.]